MNFDLLRSLVLTVLRSPYDLKWSVQGLGMFRTYLDDAQRFRLHIWDSEFRTLGVSPIHDHPWHLHSTVVAGEYRQKRYVLGEPYPGVQVSDQNREMLNMVLIKCGEGACTKSEPMKVVAYSPYNAEIYRPGQSYWQDKSEVHESMPVDGTVTVVERTFVGDRDTARVFWRGGFGWVDAAPRPAEVFEVSSAVKKALEKF